jgi:hypothetical protein
VARRAARWVTGLGDYVACRGAAALALELELAGHPVARSTVYSWATGRSQPRPSVAQAIVAGSGGVLSLADIYGGQRTREERWNST